MNTAVAIFLLLEDVKLLLLTTAKCTSANKHKLLAVVGGGAVAAAVELTAHRHMVGRAHEREKN